MKLHSRILGTTGQPIIILHGLFGTSDNWQTLAKEFAKNYIVYLVDARNHGHSAHVDEINYLAMANDVRELILHEKIEKPIIIGHSMGGKTAMFFAQQFPNLIDKLIVVDMGVKKYAPHHQQIFDALNAVDLNVVNTRKEAEKIISSYIHETSTIQFLLKNLYWIQEGKLAWRMNLPVIINQINNILVEVPSTKCKVETLFIRGEKSTYILDEDWNGIQEIFGNSKLETIDGAGHWVHAEAPEKFYTIVKGFIS